MQAQIEEKDQVVGEHLGLKICGICTKRRVQLHSEQMQKGKETSHMICSISITKLPEVFPMGPYSVISFIDS